MSVYTSWYGRGTCRPCAGIRGSRGHPDAHNGYGCGNLCESFGEGSERSFAKAGREGELGDCGGAAGSEDSCPGPADDRGTDAGIEAVRRLGVAAVYQVIGSALAGVHRSVLRDL